MSEPAGGPRREPPEPAASPRASHRGTLQLATALGIPIRIHFSFLLLLAWAGFQAVGSGASFLSGVVFIVLVFGCVVLHELGHAAMAKQFGVETREIVLYPIGGIARLDRIPSGKAEFLIALAGPAVNLALVLVLFTLFVFQPLTLPKNPSQLFVGGPLLIQLMQVNAGLLVFNMIPAFPMDGGRVLRSALTFFTAEDRATRIAARVGQVCALGFAAVAVLSDPPRPFLLLIAFFVFMGAGQEAAFQRQRTALAGLTAREAMMTRFETLAPQDSLTRAAQLLVASSQHDFPVVDAWGRVVGLVRRAVLVSRLAADGRETSVLEVMDREVRAVPPETPLERVIELLQAPPLSPLLVIEGQTLAGMITLESLSQLAAVSRGLRRN